MIEICKKDKLNHYKKGKLTGSFCGMRYLIASKELEESRVLVLYVWPEPYCFDVTKEEEKEMETFDFTEEGLKELEQALNHKYEERQEFWREKSKL